MKKFLKEYLNLFAYAALGLVFVITSFYLLINYYHSKELEKRYYVSDTDSSYISYKNKIEEIKNTLDTYNKNRNKNTSYLSLYTRLSTCKDVLETDGGLAKMETNKYYSPYDVYKLGQTFQGKLINTCWVVQLSYLTTDAVPKGYEEVVPFAEREIEIMGDRVSYALEELENNGSYFFSTGITSATIRNYLRSDYIAIVKSYNDFADVILNLSKKLNTKEEVKEESTVSGGVSDDQDIQ